MENIVFQALRHRIHAEFPEFRGNLALRENNSEREVREERREMNKSEKRSWEIQLGLPKAHKY